MSAFPYTHNVCLFVRWFSHLPTAHLPENTKKKRFHQSDHSGTPKQGVLRPQGDCHSQVTMLNITLSLDTERLIKARDRGSQGADEQVTGKEKDLN